MTIDYGNIYCKGKNVNLNATQSYYEGGGRTLGDLLDLVYPVGSIYMNVENINPEDVFGGTWERISQGRFLIGAGAPLSNNETTFGDLNNNGYVFNAKGMGGQYNHTLTVNEMPAHSHTFSGVNTGASSTGSLGSYPARIWQDTAPNWTGYFIHNSGGSQSHNNIPPYYGVYIWKRTA